MISEQEINAERERLYESGALRDDLNDAEAEVLLKWGETAVHRMAILFPAEFEQKARFLRQLLKNINRFVGQREFNELDGQKQYLSKVLMYLPQLGWDGIDEAMLFAAMPEDRKDMMGTLMAILNILTPPADASLATEQSEPPTAPAPDILPSDSPEQADLQTTALPDDQMPLENPDEHSINHPAPDISLGENTPYGEEEY
jgi:hypothetical protein